MKTAKGWKKSDKPAPTLEEIRAYLEKLFKVEPPRFTLGYPVYYTRDDGTEMITFRGGSVMGGAMPLAEWHAMQKRVIGEFSFKAMSDERKEVLTSTKVTLDHNIEVTITYDGNDSQTAE